jgi:hypothetical protein
LNKIEEIENLAGLQFTKKEVSIITQIPMSKFEEDTDENRAFLRGCLKAIAEVRQSILKMAKQGSSPAQNNYLKLIDDRIKSEKLEEKRENPQADWDIVNLKKTDKR